MKKLITVQWSYTVEVEVPEGVTVDDLEDYNAPEEIANIANTAIVLASDSLSWKDGVITDMQDL